MTGRRERTGTDPRVVRSRAAILEAATTLFLRDGYTATTMDDIADEAGVSKRTVYNNFTDKEALFREVALAATGIAEEFATDAAAELADPDDLQAALFALARSLAAAATDPRVVRLRRLLISEAHRFPELAAEYYRVGPGRVMATLAAALESVASQGRLHLTDPDRAAEQFAFLVLGAALDGAMFDGRDKAPDSDSLARAADDGVRTFLAAYGRPPG
ncbi:MAG TPA: TetR/AcrR family transcriptional regulator [Solirubrobacterales bacterium]|nr:TetR/AcrR family transcriptional regulator [Solirubrobacterales bacterium]